jgi:hypothetical protein
VTGRKLILAISDLQVPFEHQDALEFCQHVLKTFSRPGDTVQVMNMGDEVDQHTLGKYASNPNGHSAGDELEIAKDRLKPWFKAFPKVKVCTSNHTWRAYKKAFEVGIPSQFLKHIGEVYGAPPGWEWNDRWTIDGIVFEHGEGVSGETAALKAAIQNRMCTVIGHQHSHAGVVHSGTFHNTIWGLNTGCLIDVENYAFAYGIKLRKKPTLGIGLIIDRVPYFVPMYLNHKKRWVKRL